MSASRPQAAAKRRAWRGNPAAMVLHTDFEPGRGIGGLLIIKEFWIELQKPPLSCDNPSSQRMPVDCTALPVGQLLDGSLRPVGKPAEFGTYFLCQPVVKVIGVLAQRRSGEPKQCSISRTLESIFAKIVRPEREVPKLHGGVFFRSIGDRYDVHDIRTDLPPVRGRLAVVRSLPAENFPRSRVIRFRHSFRLAFHIPGGIRNRLTGQPIPEHTDAHGHRFG